MGLVQVESQAYYGAQTQRARENFPFSGLRFARPFLQALGLIKKYAAQVNEELGLLPVELSQPIMQAAQEVIDGRLDEHFVVDIFQTGSGTSTNMNGNEVIAGRANELLTGQRGGRQPVHPNDHVNLGQSSNDVIPTALHLAALLAVQQQLRPAMADLQAALTEKATEFAAVAKIGRTHLQDAVPVTLGQEFSGYARQVELGLGRLTQAEQGLYELALGGTAVGTGVNSHPEFAGRVIACLAQDTSISLQEAANHFEAQAAQDGAVQLSAALKTFAVSLSKIANDLRWLASGPRCGLAEIELPALQPGSSIMPGKVNPVIPEAVLQICGQVIGNDSAITFAGLGGNFELHVMLPLISHNLLQSIELLARGCQVFTFSCVSGIKANEQACQANLEKSLMLATALAPHIGYDQAAAIAKEAHASGQTIRQVALAQGLLPAEELHQILDAMINLKEMNNDH